MIILVIYTLLIYLMIKYNLIKLLKKKISFQKNILIYKYMKILKEKLIMKFFEYQLKLKLN